MYLTGFSVKWCEVVQSGVNTRLVVIFTYGRTLGWSQNPLPVGQRLKTVYLSTEFGVILWGSAEGDSSAQGHMCALLFTPLHTTSY